MISLKIRRWIYVLGVRSSNSRASLSKICKEFININPYPALNRIIVLGHKNI